MDAELNAEKNVVKLILERFPVLEGHVRIRRRGRIAVDPLVHRDFEKVFAFVSQGGGFNRFLMLSGTDDGDWLGVTYFLSNADEVVLMLRQRALKASPQIRSICRCFPNALWQERELADLLGFQVEELPPGPRYPLPADWPAGNYPLRKDWNPQCFNRDSMTYEPNQATAGASKEGGE